MLTPRSGGPTGRFRGRRGVRALSVLLLLPLILVQVEASGSGSSVDIKYMYYWDRNGVWNHTPALVFLQRLPGYFSLRWNQELDAVSGASRHLGLRKIGRLGDNEKELDGISGASRSEIRHSEQGTVAYAKDGREASASLYFSDENDYTSWSPSVTASVDLNERNTTLSGSWALFLDDFHPATGFEGRGGRRRIQSVTLGVTQLISPLSLLSVSVSPIRSTGYLGHPYNPVITAAGAMLDENLPDSKLSLAYTAKWVQGFQVAGRLASLHAEARHYRDDWRLVSNTVDLQWHQYLTDRTYVRVRGRGYRQGAAAFYREAYAGDELYRTADIRFSAFSSLTVGAKLASAFPESWSESSLLPDRWDIGYDHGIRDTKGENDGVNPFYQYQLYGPDQYYLQGTFMAGLGFDL